MRTRDTKGKGELDSQSFYTPNRPKCAACRSEPQTHRTLLCSLRDIVARYELASGLGKKDKVPAQQTSC
ncbi:uncharacterized [Tachysurus ichikawai]